MKVFIIGGGITGLSAAWVLQKKAEVTLFEKTNRLGGWIRTVREQGFLFEKGPRTFPVERSPHLLRLVQELGLPILYSDPSVHAKRYLLYRGKLRTPLSLLPRFLPAFLRELFVAPSEHPDESIYAFATRRFGPKIAETFFDPLTLGIYAGDIRKLSICACFPALHQWEREKGSVLRGLWSQPRAQKRGLFTLQNGMESLVHALAEQLDVRLNSHVQFVDAHTIQIDGKTLHVDQVIWATPPELPARSLSVVNLGYDRPVLKKKAFGYLVPTQEKESLLGVLFDSAIFPAQNLPHETRLTAMVRAEEPKPLEAALSALERHLQIQTPPVYTSVFRAEQAIPQFEVGCTYPYGLSVDACIQRGFEISRIPLF